MIKESVGSGNGGYKNYKDYNIGSVRGFCNSWGIINGRGNGYGMGEGINVRPFNGWGDGSGYSHGNGDGIGSIFGCCVINK